MYVAHIKSLRTHGSHQGRIRVVNDTYPMSYKDGPGITMINDDSTADSHPQ